VTDIIKLDNRQGFIEDIKHTLHCLRTTQEQYFRLRRVLIYISFLANVEFYFFFVIFAETRRTKGAES
jgi:hypothetical protein